MDDDLELLSSFQMILRKTGYRLQTSVNGKGAIRVVRQLKFEVAIVDIKLPDIMGDEVVRQIRKIDETMAVTLITGYPSLQDCIDAIDLGIQEILPKPVGADELLRVNPGRLVPQTTA